MNTLRVVTRVIVCHENNVLLARNKNANFWYPPGGGWEFEDESLRECVEREVMEETGYKVVCENLMWVSEFRQPEESRVSLETFWRARLANDNTQSAEKLAEHIDGDPGGMVEECRWFTLSELAGTKVLPKFLATIEDITAVTHDAFVTG